MTVHLSGFAEWLERSTEADAQLDEALSTLFRNPAHKRTVFRPVTRSLDAALRLVAERFPGWKRTLTIDEGYCTAHVIPNGGDSAGVADERAGFAHAPTAPLALCLALVRAELKRSLKTDAEK